MKKYPVYNIQNFNRNLGQQELYINTFSNHLINNSFIESSHGHNFYLLVLFTKGSGVHKIDFNTFTISPGCIYTIQPGQVHSWKLSKDIDGYIMFYTKDIYNLYFGAKRVEDYPFYQASTNISEVCLNEAELSAIEVYFKLLVKENFANNTRKLDKLLNLIDIIHIEISRKQLQENNVELHSYSQKMQEFNIFLDRYYAVEKSPAFYASKMNITLKHLNRICKYVLNKTVTALIAEKVVIESKRMLTFSDKPVGEIAQELGYENYSYFSRLFKKYTKTVPSKFRARLKLDNW
ncbi:transcriptional regulator, AraC family [Cellulophaga algicola DSM 14237]|uniref:Transcriptional regulator, AraC family n=1 Tax=Cellulophaga algicola (strain DSM 14237 / IC166 / ACAM 630) TaxID=688270 RepID=E6X3P0_CELAD|nr:MULTISPECIES: helix-turn-helix transcriptional regulator [Cellulophaga]ADV48193.1 transcriptional regulator, AraC family [Cellulophaga algicola DSM 14237]